MSVIPSFFCYPNGMEEDEKSSLLSEVERVLKDNFNVDEANKDRIPSDAKPSKKSDRIDQLVLPDSQRPKMPFTKDKYLVRENPNLVQWEREVRKFLRNLSPNHGHRITAVMIYEWATGIRVKELQEKGGSATGDIRHIHRILRYYFDKPYMTYIAGRKVPKAYRVRPGYYIRRHRPMTLTLYAEYVEGVLYP